MQSTITTIAETRSPVPVPPPIAGASKQLRCEYVTLQARADALELDKANAPKHRGDYANEIEAAAEAVAEAANESAAPSKTTRELIAGERGDAYEIAVAENQAWAWEAQQIRDIGVNLLEKELALRSDLAGYLARRQSEGQKSIDSLRLNLEETRAGVKGDSKYGGFDDPAKLSSSDVLPGDVDSHPTVVAARNKLRAVERIVRDKSKHDNPRQIKELRRMIQTEAARFAGSSVR